LKGDVDLSRAEVVVLDGVAWLGDDHVAEGRDGAQEGDLNLQRKARARAVEVSLGVAEALRLQHEEVPLAVGEAHDLLLQARAVARPSPRDPAGGER
jgi:hypothetical protein